VRERDGCEGGFVLGFRGCLRLVWGQGFGVYGVGLMPYGLRSTVEGQVLRAQSLRVGVCVVGAYGSRFTHSCWGLSPTCFLTALNVPTHSGFRFQF
jgi:hypothetical protein